MAKPITKAEAAQRLRTHAAHPAARFNELVVDVTDIPLEHAQMRKRWESPAAHAKRLKKLQQRLG